MSVRCVYGSEGAARRGSRTDGSVRVGVRAAGRGEAEWLSAFATAQQRSSTGLVGTVGPGGHQIIYLTHSVIR